MKPNSVSSVLLACVVLGSPCTLAANEESVHHWAQQQEAAGRLSGAAVASIRGDDIAVRGFGRRGPDDATPPDAWTQFQFGSITKVFTNLLLAEMVDAGMVKTTDTLGELMPQGFAPRNRAVASISLRALSTHTSGLPRLPANLDLSSMLDPYASYDAAALQAGLTIARDRQPLGSFYAYSNFGLGTLGYLLGRVSGDGYVVALHQRVIAPLGLQHTRFAPAANAATAFVGGKPVTPWSFQDSLAGAGALWGSAEDLGRLVQAYLGSHEHELAHPLDADLKVQDVKAGAFEVTPVWHVARADGKPIYWHNGGTAGFWSFVGFRPDQQRGIAILVSGDADPTAAGLAALGHVAPQAEASAADAGLFGQYQLTEQFGIGVFELSGALVAQATGQPSLAIHAVGDDWYAYGDVDASLRFQRSEGQVMGLELAQGGQLHEAKRVADVAAVMARKPTLDATASQSGVSLDAAQLEQYVGTFGFAPGVELSVRRSGEGIEAQLTGQSWFPVFARASDRFFYKVVEAELQFERDAEGKVVAVVLHQGGIEQRAARLP